MPGLNVRLPSSQGKMGSALATSPVMWFGSWRLRYRGCLRIAVHKDRDIHAYIMICRDMKGYVENCRDIAGLRHLLYRLESALLRGL